MDQDLENATFESENGSLFKRDSPDKSAAIASGFLYDVTSTKVMKHKNDICVTNKPSKRSESVKDVSLDDLIAERKIAAPVKRDRAKSSGGSNFFFSEDSELGLDDIIQKRKSINKDRANIDKSLDDIIKESKSNNGNGHFLDDNNHKDFENGEQFVNRKRKRQTNGIEDLEEERYYPTPLEVVTNLTEEGLLIEQEIGKQEEVEDGRSHLWRAHFKCGGVSVQCDSARKILARQGAALEFLKALKSLEPNRPYPESRIPEACYYDPVVITRLSEVLLPMGLGEPRFEIVMTRKNNKDFYTTTYFIGDDEFVGESYNVDHSKVMAAKAAYETYSEKKFHRDNYFVGEKCIDNSKYICRETEAVHILTVDENVLAVDDEDESMLATAEAEELLMDDAGQLYVRSANAPNKIRRLTSLNSLDI